MEEAWKDYYSENELAEIQRIELESLDVFSEICKKLDIKFFLYGGTLLGAVKYGGFVPWDDDLDIALERNDYEKLIKEGLSLIPDGYELQEPRINKRTPYPYTKFRKKNTTMVEYVNRNVKINHGVYFDIYPIDSLPDDDIELDQSQRKFLKWTRILHRRQTYSLYQPAVGWRGTIKKSMRVCLFLLLKLVPHFYIIKKLNAIMTKYNNMETKRQGNLFFPKPVNYFTGINPPIEVYFEGRKMLIPSGYEINLQNRYGDITKDPPAEKRVGHRPYILNLNLED